MISWLLFTVRWAVLQLFILCEVELVVFTYSNTCINWQARIYLYYQWFLTVDKPINHINIDQMYEWNKGSSRNIIIYWYFKQIYWLLLDVCILSTLSPKFTPLLAGFVLLNFFVFCVIFCIPLTFVFFFFPSLYCLFLELQLLIMFNRVAYI
jgi:hypothetical protein